VLSSTRLNSVICWSGQVENVVFVDLSAAPIWRNLPARLQHVEFVCCGSGPDFVVKGTRVNLR